MLVVPAQMSGPPAAELENVSKDYRLGVTEVRGVRSVTLRIDEGELAAVVGPSGSGKSTLLNLIGCIDEPDSGTVTIAGVEVRNMTDAQLSRFRSARLGFIFQSFNLIPVLTAFENIEVPLLVRPDVNAAERRSRVEDALDAVGLTAFARHVPEKLSGGQRQRVAIARALVTRPSIVLADEPTANLDSATATKIVDLMADLNASRGTTFLFSTHDEKLMKRVHRLIRLEDGALVA